MSAIPGQKGRGSGWFVSRVVMILVGAAFSYVHIVVGTLFIDIVNNYCYGSGLVISILKGHISLISKLVIKFF